jgi:Sulfotransferase domain
MTLPNFLIIGAAKAGTTSIYEYLRQHPDVFMSPVKEPEYFCGTMTRAEYERLFDAVTTERAVGEASTRYLNSDVAPRNVAAELPAVRLIVSLRNPVDRAYSSYLGRLREAREHCSVEEAMRPASYYCQSSLYAPSLARWLEHFDRINAVIFDDLVADPRAVMRDLYDFVGVDSAFVPDVRAQHNAGSVPKNLAVNKLFWGVVNAIRPAVRNTGLAGRIHRRMVRRPDLLPPALRARMLDFFRDDIATTGTLIGRDLSRWLA